MIIVLDYDEKSSGDDTAPVSGHIQFSLISLAPRECDNSAMNASFRAFYAIYNIYELTDDTRRVLCGLKMSSLKSEIPNELLILPNA